MKVLVALDGSPVSMHAAHEAVRLFASTEAEFLVINVARLPTLWIYPAGFGGVAAIPPLDLQRLAEPSESDVAATAARAGIEDAEVLTDVGDPVGCICAAAEDHDVDVVVVGSHDRGVCRGCSTRRWRLGWCGARTARSWSSAARRPHRPVPGSHQRTPRVPIGGWR